MEDKLTKLKEILLEELSLHESLREDLHDEAEQDGQMDSKALLQIQHRKSHKANSLQSLEHNRTAIVNQLAAHWGLDPDSLTLRDIIPRAPHGLAVELRECHGRLLGLVEEIQGLARQTSANAQARLRAVEATLSVINEAVKVHATYSESGQLSRRIPTFKETSV